jgi:hypothetical protein
MVAVGTLLPAAPRADPGVRLSRTGLLSQVEYVDERTALMKHWADYCRTVFIHRL